jgi:hypothetical protein
MSSHFTLFARKEPLRQLDNFRVQPLTMPAMAFEQPRASEEK